MDAREKEQYLREYSILKNQGKPFFPYAIAKDGAMACVTLAVIITLSIVLGAELGPKADPTTTTYTPRPEWYFFFLFELLRVVKPPELVFLATIGIPTVCLVLLLVLPFIDRNPERNPLRRPIADGRRHRDDRRDGLPHDRRSAGGVAHGDRPTGATGAREGPGGDGLVRLPRLPQGRREREHARPEPQPHRRQARQGRDRADAAESDPADADYSRSSGRRPSSSTSSSITSRRSGASDPARPGAARSPIPRCARCSIASRACTTS